jgi:hypothetical protein
VGAAEPADIDDAALDPSGSQILAGDLAGDLIDDLISAVSLSPYGDGVSSEPAQ